MAIPIEPDHALLLGITVKDIVTAILVPLVAVMTTLWYQERQQVRAQRLQILRTLLATRLLPADGNFNAAINLVPVEFNKVRLVMAAWSEYIKQVRFAAPLGGERAHNDQVNARKTKLISAIMAKLGMKFSEADLQVDAYLSQGFVERDSLYLDSLRAARLQAEAMTDVAKAIREQS